MTAVVSTSTLTHSKSTVTHSKHRNPYELHLAVSGNQRQIVRHSTADLVNWSGNRLRHSLAITFTMRGNAVEELLTIHDLTNGDTLKVSQPGRNIRAIVWTSAAVSFVVTLLIAGIALNGSPSSYLLALLAALAGYYVATEQASPRVKLTTAERHCLEASQALLTQKNALADARVTAITDCNSKYALMTQLERLAAKMHAADHRVYASRIKRLGAAHQLLEEQAEIDKELVRGYERAITMIDIEVESLATAGEVTDSPSSTIEAKIAELDALKEEMKERERMLGANEELETFLAASNRLASTDEKRDLGSADDYAPGIPLEHLFDELENREDDETGD